jgi:hypothetical protein
MPSRSSAGKRRDARAHRRLAFERGDELLEGRRAHDETRRHRDAGAGQLAEAATLAAHRGAIPQADVFEPADDVDRIHGLRYRAAG